VVGDRRGQHLGTGHHDALAVEGAQHDRAEVDVVHRPLAVGDGDLVAPPERVAKLEDDAGQEVGEDGLPGEGQGQATDA
jgi:hypothetical protein